MQPQEEGHDFKVTILAGHVQGSEALLWWERTHNSACAWIVV